MQLLDWMHERGAAVAPGVEWLENHLCGCDLTTHAVLARERQRQAANQVSIGNCVTTLRVLSALDWAAFFERTSRVEAELRQDPSGVYARQDFPTRDRYRREVEKLSRGSHYDELEVARQAVGMAARRAHSEPPANHVGYYLIDEGRTELERLLHYRSKPRDAFRTFVLNHPRLVYFSGLAVVVAVAVGRWPPTPPRARRTVAVVLAVAAVLAALPPAGDIAVSLVNSWLTSFLPPRVLPKLRFKEGIPADCATFVVMPTLLARPQSAAGLLEHLRDPSFIQSRPAAALRPADRFQRRPSRTHAGRRRDRSRRPGRSSRPQRALRRRRAGSLLRLPPPPPVERRPGVLDGLGTQAREIVGIQPPPARRPRHQLHRSERRPQPAAAHPLRHHARRRHAAAPRRRARLIATLAHPLNRPRFDPVRGRVTAGYGVLQPRISLTLTGIRKSRFARIFGGSAGLDPYTAAISDVYQDLFGAGTFTGKGAYDVDAFEASAGAPSPTTTF